MDKKEAEFRKRLLATFAIEAEEHISAISKGLLELENPENIKKQDAIVEIVFREAHSLKGAARAVNNTEIESICRNLENIFSSWKQGKLDSSRESFDTIHMAVDNLTILMSGNEDESANQKEKSNSIQQQLQEIQNHNEANHEIEDQKSPDSIELEESEDSRITVQKGSNTIRISKAKLDSLLTQTEEMLSVGMKLKESNRTLREIKSQFNLLRKSVLVKEQAEAFKSIDRQFERLIRSSDENQRIVSGMVNDLLHDTRKALMLPFSTLLEIFPKLTRDLARDQGKLIELQISGSELEIDKRILEEMKDPLVHLLRNCIDHGIEKPEKRKELAKPEYGKIKINIKYVPGKRIELIISDDGSGINLARVKQEAKKHGYISDTENETLPKETVDSLIFKSGISTSSIITDISGRGLGLAIVREKIDKLGGSVHVESKPLEGTTFNIRLPMTMASFKGVFVQLEEQVFILPSASVRRILRIRPNEIRTVENKQVISIDNKTIAYKELKSILELKTGKKIQKEGEFLHILILGSSDKQFAFCVDEILYEQEVLVKPIGAVLKRVRNIDGATVLGSGKVIPILNVSDLIKSAVKFAGGSAAISKTQDEPDTSQKSIVVAEDSITSRMLLKDILESAGYLVKTAVDGADALAVLREKSYDILISDVDMPRMNGFELASKVRSDKVLEDLPVVLVTSLQSREDKERGMEAGANAYIEKGSFDPENLLDVIRRLI